MDTNYRQTQLPKKLSSIYGIRIRKRDSSVSKSWNLSKSQKFLNTSSLQVNDLTNLNNFQTKSQQANYLKTPSADYSIKESPNRSIESIFACYFDKQVKSLRVAQINELMKPLTKIGNKLKNKLERLTIKNQTDRFNQIILSLQKSVEIFKQFQPMQYILNQAIQHLKQQNLTIIGLQQSQRLDLKQNKIGKQALQSLQKELDSIKLQFEDYKKSSTLKNQELQTKVEELYQKEQNLRKVNSDLKSYSKKLRERELIFKQVFHQLQILQVPVENIYIQEMQKYKQRTNKSSKQLQKTFIGYSKSE